MIAITPDPAHPRGGYARISIPAADVPEGPISITIRNSFNDKFLGQGGWQAGKAFFGPYDVNASGDRAEFIIGAEVVNLIEEYTALAITIGEREYEISWPDDIMEGPPAATVGGVSVTPHAARGNTGPALVGKAKPDEEVPDTDAVAETTKTPGETGTATQAADVPHTTQHSKSSSRTPLFAGIGLVAVLAVAGAFWYFVLRTEPLALDTCSDEGLRTAAADSGFASVLETLQTCGTAASEDAAFLLLEDAIDANDALALASMGRLYDQSEQAEVLETDFALSYSDTPPRAAEYYSRAVAAGDGVGAAEALTAICARLLSSSDTLSVRAHQEYCQE